ncbi:MAG TPA: Smr/MutS family protein [Thermoanaerobaculia bacterium]|nr:Smr/MutS family protein [Thermoanaerobaculia bacterium]
MNDDPVEIPIEDVLDLHPFRPNEIRDVTLEYLTVARERGLRQVRLIHGRGMGVQRANVQSLLATLDWVESFHDADHTGGGWGATVVLLRPGS